MFQVWLAGQVLQSRPLLISPLLQTPDSLKPQGHNAAPQQPSEFGGMGTVVITVVDLAEEEELQSLRHSLHDCQDGSAFVKEF